MTVPYIERNVGLRDFKHLWVGKRSAKHVERNLVCSTRDIPKYQNSPNALRAMRYLAFERPQFIQTQKKVAETLNKWFDLIRQKLLKRQLVWASGWENPNGLISENGENINPLQPISGNDINGFSCWQPESIFKGRIHEGVDYIAYSNVDGNVVRGLPPNTPVVACLPGIVLDIKRSYGLKYAYYDGISIAHAVSSNGNNLYVSSYIHVDLLAEATVFPGQWVRAGEQITVATLRNDTVRAMENERNCDAPNHLHFELQNWNHQFVKEEWRNFGGERLPIFFRQFTSFDPAYHIAHWAKQ